MALTLNVSRIQSRPVMLATNAEVAVASSATTKTSRPAPRGPAPDALSSLRTPSILFPDHTARATAANVHVTLLFIASDDLGY
ncbi:MAG: hypothetical protein KGI65_01885 [Acidobacteriota bacterium]|nr:hypothetical protein [Acidobacteriota bacterium]